MVYIFKYCIENLKLIIEASSQSTEMYALIRKNPILLHANNEWAD